MVHLRSQLLSAAYLLWMGSSFCLMSCHYLLLCLLATVSNFFSTSLAPPPSDCLWPATSVDSRRHSPPSGRGRVSLHSCQLVFLQRVWSGLRVEEGSTVTNKSLSVNERQGKEVGRQSVINLAAVGSFTPFIPTVALRLKPSLSQTEMGGDRRCAELCVHFVWKNAPKSHPTEDELLLFHGPPCWRALLLLLFSPLFVSLLFLQLRSQKKSVSETFRWVSTKFIFLKYY